MESEVKKKKMFKLAFMNVTNHTVFCCFISSMLHLIRLIKSYFHVAALFKVVKEPKGFPIAGKPYLGLLPSIAEIFMTL